MEAAGVKLLLLLLLLGDLASANLSPVGPYTLEVLEISKCDDGEYPGLSLDMSLVMDEEGVGVAYAGNFTITYDLLADDCEIQTIHYRWGSTGGWGKIYSMNFTKPYDYLKANFPSMFDTVREKIGITVNPVIPGTYYFKSTTLRGFTFDKFPMLPYGKYWSIYKGLKDGEPMSCLQTVSIVNEVPLSLGFGIMTPF